MTHTRILVKLLYLEEELVGGSAAGSPKWGVLEAFSPWSILQKNIASWLNNYLMEFHGCFKHV